MILVIIVAVLIGLDMAAESDQPGLNPSGSGSSDVSVHETVADSKNLIEEYHGLVDYIESAYVQILVEVCPSGVNTNHIEALFDKRCRLWKSMGTVTQRRTMFLAFCEDFDKYIDGRCRPSRGFQIPPSQTRDCKKRWKAVIRYVDRVFDAVKSDAALAKALDAESGPVNSDGILLYKSIICLEAVKQAAAEVMALLSADNHKLEVEINDDLPQTLTPESLYMFFTSYVLILEKVPDMVPSMRSEGACTLPEEKLNQVKKRCEKLSVFIDDCFHEVDTHHAGLNPETFDFPKPVIELDDALKAN